LKRNCLPQMLVFAIVCRNELIFIVKIFKINIFFIANIFNEIDNNFAKFIFIHVCKIFKKIQKILKKFVKFYKHMLIFTSCFAFLQKYVNVFSYQP
jgi:hypothetical protein